MPNLNTNSTNYVHSFEPNTNDLTMAMDYNALGQPVIRTAFASSEVVTANTAFGEPVAAQLVPVVQVETIHELDLDELQLYTGGGGSIGTTNSIYYAQTSTTAYSYAVLRTRRFVRYRPGQGAMARFTAMFDAKADTTLRVGMANQEEALQLGFNGTRFGIYHRYGAKAELRTLTITTPPPNGVNTNATITLNGVAFTVALVSGETANQTASRIARATYTGWLTEQKDNDVRFLSSGATQPLDGTFTFSHATAAGTFTRTQTGNVGTENWIYQEDFNIDTLDGNGPSAVSIDFTKLNVFQMNYRWLGAGGGQFAIEHPSTGAMMFFHKIRWTNVNTRPWVDNPGFKITYTAYNLGGTEVASVKGCSMAGFIEGGITRNNYTRAYSIQKSSLASGSTHNIFTIKNPLIYSGKINTKEIVLQDVALAHQGNDPCQVFVFLEAELVGAGEIYTRLPQAVATVSTITGTIDPTLYTPVAAFILGINGQAQYDLTPYRIVVPPGTRASVAVRSNQGISQISAALVWLAD